MQLLEGKALSIRLNDRLIKMVDLLIEKTKAQPKLVTVFIGHDTASEWYNKSIKKACENVGIDYELFEYSSIEFQWAKDLIVRLNQNPDIHGILINQPLPDGFQSIVEMIDPEKDVEGVTAHSLGCLILNQEIHVPCTPQAVMTLIDDYKIDLTGLKVCMLGRSNIVGKPLSIMLTQRNATVTLCHSKTSNLEHEVQSADVVIVAVGKPKFVKKDWIKEGAIVIDVGTNYSGNGLVGDVDFESVKEKVSMITPVPGGVGGLTNIILLKNCVEAFKRQKGIKSDFALE